MQHTHTYTHNHHLHTHTRTHTHPHLYESRGPIAPLLPPPFFCVCVCLETLCRYGFLDSFDEAYDRITSKSDKTLERADQKDFYYVTTTDDPVIEELATKGAGTVFGTDSIFSHLMACPR